MFNQLPKLSPAELKVKLDDQIFMVRKLQHESCFPEICYTRAAKRPAKIGPLLSRLPSPLHRGSPPIRKS